MVKGTGIGSVRKQIQSHEKSREECQTILNNVKELKEHVNKLLDNHYKTVARGEHSEAAHTLDGHILNERKFKYTSNQPQDVKMKAHLYDLENEIMNATSSAMIQYKMEIANPETEKLLLAVKNKIENFEKNLKDELKAHNSRLAQLKKLKT
jgi:hypothetical protein